MRKKIDIRHLAAALLAALMLLSATACGTGDSGSGTEKATGTQAEETGSETETDNSLICDLPKDLNYGGDEVTIIYAKASGREDELVSEGLGNGTVSDAVYERNQMVETQLKIKFALVAEDGLNVASKVDTDIKSSSGKPEFDIVVNGTYMAVTPAIEGKYKNLSALNNIDTGKSYWTQGYNNLRPLLPPTASSWRRVPLPSPCSASCSSRSITGRLWITTRRRICMMS